jgi:hypothetical protein
MGTGTGVELSGTILPLGIIGEGFRLNRSSRITYATIAAFRAAILSSRVVSGASDQIRPSRTV